jgi:uncharacterized protein YuzE
MFDMTCDPGTDAAILYVSASRKVDRTKEIGSFIDDVNIEGQIVGIEILSASAVESVPQPFPCGPSCGTLKLR